ncbi:putative glucan 1,3-beta-glucosidase D [Colletotrichum sidae]|uniref:glucan 1,3-beta-glucosidase n=1 Tax=Colletotrichum sidae TaxID=1347389 RepID=A0A4R8T3I6_9PEZI|nr:putative glucan 1,3-beta-glucosidase D [Colletotrichum sidae]
MASNNTSREDIVAKPERAADGLWSPSKRDFGTNSQPVEEARKTRQKWILLGVLVGLVVIAAIVVGVLFATKVLPGSNSADIAASVGGAAPADSDGNNSNSGSPLPSATSQTGASQPSGSPKLSSKCSTASDIPSSAKGGSADVTSWSDMLDFNCTFTDETVGGLSIAGLNATWDDSKQANSKVPALNKPWGSYAERPLRGVSLGGWLSLEPFITPSLFEYSPSEGVVDEFTLCKKLGKDAAKVLEKHYSTFITEQDFKDIADAGLDHIRVPFSYWAVRTYDDDPYPAGLSWRYLLRGIEWARKHGLRIKLDLHGLPGSQNGWNHSGRQGKIGWLKTSPDGRRNLQRSLDVHDQLSKFFAQDRYRNVVAFYGLANEPALTIPTDDLESWTADAYALVRGNGVNATQVFSESMKGLPAWGGRLQGRGDALAVDVHEYIIFDNYTSRLGHADKIALACRAWTEQLGGSMARTAGFGPTMVGEWSQADTDCTRHLNGVGTGARWLGTFDGETTPACPTGDERCSCDVANGDPGAYSAAYKRFLLTWAETQMSIFEKTWGWFYWSWKTESAALWSYQAGLKGGFLPARADERSFDCSKPIPSFGDVPEYY